MQWKFDYLIGSTGIDDRHKGVSLQWQRRNIPNHILDLVWKR